MHVLNATHDPNAKSWVTGTNDPQTNFPIQNLPYCVFRRTPERPEIGVGIGDQILSLKTCAELGLIGDRFANSLSQPTLNLLMEMPPKDRSQLRRLIFDLLIEDTQAERKVVETALIFQSDVTFSMPCTIGDYSDFYASVYHATNVGSMFRPSNPILPNYKHIPIGYHGRASSIVSSGTEVRRPNGQLAPKEEGGTPSREVCKLLDYELEVGCFVAQGNQLGDTISIQDAEQHIFGLALLNDWSARDIQKWEYQPLGPFLGKSFASTISPWIVTMEALAPFRCPEFSRPDGDPQPLEYLTSPENSQFGGIDLQVEVFLRSEQMREQGIDCLLYTSPSPRD